MDKLKAMTIFIAVVEEGSMSAAARRLGIANSVVTKNLNELEHWLGRKLIYRSTRSLNLSQEGHIYLQQISAIVDQVAKLEQPDDLDNLQIMGTVKLTAPVILGKMVLSQLLPAFHQEYPGIRVNLVLNDNFNDMVEEGLDLALRISRLPDSNFIARKLGTIQLKLVSSLSYVEKFGAPLKPESLNHHVCLVDNSVSNAKRWNFFTPEKENVSVQIDGPIEANNADCIVSLCEAGIGLAQLPQLFVDQAIIQGRLIELLPEYAVHFDVSLLYHQRGARNPASKALIDYLIKHIRADSFSWLK